MAKGIYVGVDGVARKAKKAYIGIDGKARKVKKAYIGIAGVARPVFSGGELVYYGSSDDGAIERLSTTKGDLCAAVAGAHAIFPPGNRSTNAPSGTFDVYGPSLTHETIDATTNNNLINQAAVTFGEYAMFGGGRSSAYGNSSKVSAFDSRLTLSDYTITQRCYATATTVGEYALFGPGRRLASSGNTAIKYVEAFDKNFTKIEVNKSSAVANTTESGTAAHVEKYAVFASSLAVEVYDEALTLTKLEKLDCECAAEVGGFAIFTRGESKSLFNTTAAQAVAIDSSLTRISIDPLLLDRSTNVSTETEDYAIFAGGSLPNTAPEKGYVANVDVYNSSLTHASVEDLAIPTYGGAAAFNGNFVIVGGGAKQAPNVTSSSSTYYYINTVTAYAV